MYLQLHQLCIHLQSEHPAINEAWRRLFSGWQAKPSPPQMRLALTLVETLPSLPARPPLFTDARPLPDDVGVLSVYAAGHGRVQLHYHDGALIDVPLQPVADVPTAAGAITPAAMRYGRFEDVTFTSLAPLLRRRGYFLLHAFAAVHHGRAVLIVGPSGSGKTTTGLNLLLHGWRLLANDILLLVARPDAVYALPTPGGVSIRPQTFALLPALRPLLPTGEAPRQRVSFSGDQVAGGRWAEPAPAAAILLARIGSHPVSRLRPINRAVSLVRLMEESVDRWDEACLAAHMELLERLIRQTAVYDLCLGTDLGALPAQIEELLS